LRRQPLNDNDGASDQHNLIFSSLVDWDRLAQVIAASVYDKEYMSIEIVMPKEPGNIYTGDEAAFLSQAMASGLRHQVEPSWTETKPTLG